MIEGYEEFLRSKTKVAESTGFEVAEAEVNPALFPHARAIVRWLVSGGRRACFASFGLHKTVIQLEAVRIVLSKAGGRGLIVIPLGVRQEFERDAVEKLRWATPPKFIRRIDEAGPAGVYLTNYETVRDGKLDPSEFTVASLDEASVLRSFGTKTFGEFMRLFAGGLRSQAADGQQVGRLKYRFVATATPSPNEYLELLAYASFLGVGDIGHVKTRFFKRDSTEADHLTLHPHKEAEFWLWLASWAIFVQRPSDLGFSDEGFVMPPIEIKWHEVESDHSRAGVEKSGQRRLLRDATISVQDAAAEKRSSLPGRIAKLMELRAIAPAEHRLLWHDLEAEREALEDVIPDLVTIRGNDDDEHKVTSIRGFADGSIVELGAKPCMLGSGVNWQRHCAWAIYLGIGFKFNDLIQSIHRILRFGQTRRVRIDLIYTEAEREVRKQLERKWSQHNAMVAKMTGLIRQYGLSHAALAGSIQRKMGIPRFEITGPGYRLVNSDSVLEADAMAEASVGLILTSIPFSSQYEYSPNYADFGHSEGNAQFFTQMDFLTPNLWRVLQPGRLCVVHVKDRVVPGGMSGLGFPTVYEFHADCIRHYKTHGFAFLGMKTIVTDVVRENNQTYRLGWTEQCKDGTKMGCGMSEYLLLFRKPQSDTSTGYADVRVAKSKDAYSRARWQVDAHGFMRSSGQRLLAPGELASLPVKGVWRRWKEFSRSTVYDFEHHVACGEALDRVGKLAPDFMLLPPASWQDDVWTDVTRMKTLNTFQAQKGKETHLCPMQFDIADRIIAQYSNPGDVVFDPFGGLMTVPMRAVKAGRLGWGCELSPQYFADGAIHVKAAADELATPTLFDIAEIEAEVA